MSKAKRDWFKSSYSGDGACVEVRLGKSVHLRDSKDADGPELTVGKAQWTAFLRGVVDGEFDMAPAADHSSGSAPA